MLILKAEVVPGTTIQDAAMKAIEIAELTRCVMHFLFNGIECRAVGWNSVDEVVNYYDQEYRRIALNGMTGFGEVPKLQE